MLTTLGTTMQPTPFAFDRASHYYMMQQQSFQIPHHLPQQGRYPQNNQEISYVILEHLKTFERLNSHAVTWLQSDMLKQSSEN